VVLYEGTGMNLHFPLPLFVLRDLAILKKDEKIIKLSYDFSHDTSHRRLPLMQCPNYFSNDTYVRSTFRVTIPTCAILAVQSSRHSISLFTKRYHTAHKFCLPTSQKNNLKHNTLKTLFIRPKGMCTLY